jgi:hypothetical protein
MDKFSTLTAEIPLYIGNSGVSLQEQDPDSGKSKFYEQYGTGIQASNIFSKEHMSILLFGIKL